MLINGESPDDEPPPDDKETVELTPEKEAICDRAEAFVKKAERKLNRGFAIKKLSRVYKKAISTSGRSDQVSDSS
jgi:hypothetical protein